MGGSASCFSLCAADDSQTPNSAIPETARWCVDDSAVEEVFIPDGERGHGNSLVTEPGDCQSY